jgi:hypothetical protein
MKSIELTEEHKSKLLEMCKVLFPEYVIYPAEDNGFIEGEQWVGDQHMGEDKPVNEFNIHWFEFCMTYLQQEMLTLGELPNFNNKLDYEFHPILQSSWWESHPVDYLYEEFKKLK